MRSLRQSFLDPQESQSTSERFVPEGGFHAQDLPESSHLLREVL